MTNISLFIFYVILAVSALSVIIVTIRKKKRSNLDKSLLFVAWMLLCWDVVEAGFFLTNDPLIIQFLFDLKLPFVALAAYAWFRYVVRFYGIDRYIPLAINVALLVVPLFTLGMALTTTEHGFIRESFVLLAIEPLHEYTTSRGPWFWYHFFYCYSLLATAFVMSLVLHRKTPKEYRLSSLLLVIGLVISIAVNIAVIKADVPIDLSLAGANIALILLYSATKRHQGLDFVIESRSDAFHHIEEAIFILDIDDTIINMNKAAEAWLKTLNIPRSEKSFTAIMNVVQGHVKKEDHFSGFENGSDYYLESGIVYNIKRKPLLNNVGTKIASFVVVADETVNRELIGYLDRHSGLDALTGLSNLRKNKEDLQTLDREENHPIAILYGDLNNLKETNDTHGHHQGDVLLRLVAEALRSVCPPSARIGRVGGDEFIIILPKHHESQVELLMEEVKSYLRRASAPYLFDASIALGYAIKRTKDQSIHETVTRADENMYADKQRVKGTVPNAHFSTTVSES